MALLTFAFYAVGKSGSFSSRWPFILCEEGGSCRFTALPVRLSYLLTAVGVALTNNRLVAQTTEWARNTSRAILPAAPRFSAEAVTFQLSLLAIAAAIEALDKPAEAVVSVGQWIGGAWFGAVLWSGMWSVVAAAAGSLVHAIFLARRT